VSAALPPRDPWRRGRAEALLPQSLEIVNRLPDLLRAHLATKGGHRRARDPIMDRGEEVRVRMQGHMLHQIRRRGTQARRQWPISTPCWPVTGDAPLRIQALPRGDGGGRREQGIVSRGACPWSCPLQGAQED
jgi:hypothetical protein